MYRAVLDNYNYFGYLKGANEVNRQYFQQTVLLCLHCIMLEYAPMLHVSYYAPNYAGIICQGLKQKLLAPNLRIQVQESVTVL